MSSINYAFSVDLNTDSPLNSKFGVSAWYLIWIYNSHWGAHILIHTNTNVWLFRWKLEMWHAINTVMNFAHFFSTYSFQWKGGYSSLNNMKQMNTDYD